MNVNILDAHDRYSHFVKQNFWIDDCCQDLIDQRPFGDHSFYIFAHFRTDEDGVRKRLIWQPRLTRPEVQVPSMLFRGYPGTQKIKIYWILPERCVWSQYAPRLVTESNIVNDSIQKFKFRKYLLEQPDKEDLSDSEIDAIYKSIANVRKPNKSIDNSDEEMLRTALKSIKPKILVGS